MNTIIKRSEGRNDEETGATSQFRISGQRGDNAESQVRISSIGSKTEIHEVSQAGNQTEHNTETVTEIAFNFFRDTIEFKNQVKQNGSRRHDTKLGAMRGYESSIWVSDDLKRKIQMSWDLYLGSCGFILF